MADGVITIEAEDIIADGYIVETQGVASGGEVASLFGGGATSGTLSYTFTDAAGAYDLVINAFDENDGEGQILVLVNGALVETFTLDGSTSSAGVGGNEVALTINALDLSAGDVIEIVGVSEAAEWMRVDNITLTSLSGAPQPPAGDVIEVEAEDIISSGYIASDSSIASSSSFASLYNSGATTGELSYTFTGGTGTYDLALDIFDENDGQSSLEVRVNGVLVAAVVMDAQTGSGGADATSLVTRTITGLELSTGDVVTVTGFAAQAEWARVDKLTFTAQGAVEPPVNAAPSGAVADIDAATGETVTIDLDTAFTDLDGDALTYSISGSGASIASLNGAILTLNPTAAGDYAITIVANDGTDDSAPVSFTVTAADPVVVDSFTIEAEDIMVSGFATEGSSRASGGEVASLLPSGASTGALSYDFNGADGVYTLAVAAFDENDGVSTLSVRVNGNEVALFTMDAQTGSSAFGADNLIDYAVSGLDLSSGDVVEVFAARGGGEYARIDTLTFTRTGESDPSQNTAPTGDIADLDAVTGAAVVIDLDQAFSDIDGDALTYTVFGAGASIASINGSILTLNPTNAGDYAITVTANDGTDDSAPVVFTLTATDPAPVGDVIVVEAEDVVASGYVVATSSAASGDEYASLFNTTVQDSASSGVLSYTFAGGAGSYDLALDIFDENDGQASLEVRVNGVLVSTIAMNDSNGSGGVDNASLTTRTISGLDLSTGDVVTVTGFADQAEWARIDKLTFTPQGAVEPPTNSAPTGAISDVALDAGETVTIDLDQAFSDIDGDALTYTVFGAGASIASINGSILTLNPTNAGDYAITVTANDGTDDSAPVSFTVLAADPGVDPTPLETIVLEGEDLIASGFVVESSSPASGGQVASLLNSGASTGTLSYVFNGGAGTYDLFIDAFDENDGVATLSVRVNGQQVQLITMDGDTNNGAMGSDNLLTFTVAGLDLSAGDVVEIVAVQGGGEYARIDTLTFSPVDAGDPDPNPDPTPDPTGAAIGLGLTEAETLDLAGGADIESLSNYANGEGVRNYGDIGEEGSVSGVFTGAAGDYVVSVNYLDESDGQASWTLEINGVVVSSWDGVGGTDSTGSAATQQVAVSLSPGDAITVTGVRNDGGEMARLDSISIGAAQDPVLTAEDFDFFAFTGQSNAEHHFYRASGDTSPGDLGYQVFEDTITALTGYDTTAIEASRGGSASNETADPSSYWWDLANDQPGPELIAAVNTINAALAGGKDLDGIIWAQGEDDARAITSLTGDADYYVQNLKTATTKVFEYFWSLYGRDVPIFIQEIGDFDEGGSNYSDGPVGALDLIREAQAELIAELDGVYLGAETGDVPHLDTIHFNVTGYGQIAEDLATSAVDEISGGVAAASASTGVVSIQRAAIAEADAATDSQNADGFLLSAEIVPDAAPALVVPLSEPVEAPQPDLFDLFQPLDADLVLDSVLSLGQDGEVFY